MAHDHDIRCGACGFPPEKYAPLSTHICDCRFSGHVPHTFKSGRRVTRTDHVACERDRWFSQSDLRRDQWRDWEMNYEALRRIERNHGVRACA